MVRAELPPVKSARAETLASDFASRQLTGRDRTELERSILSRPDIKAADRAVLLAIFNRCWGKAVCWPGNASLAMDSGVSPRTIPNALARLEGLGIIRTVDDYRVHSRRRIVLLPHPDSAAALDELGTSPQVRMDRVRIGAPAKDKSRRTLQILQPQDCIPCNPGIANSATEASESEARESQEFAGGEDFAPPENPEPVRQIAAMPPQVHRAPAAEKPALKAVPAPPVAPQARPEQRYPESPEVAAAKRLSVGRARVLIRQLAVMGRKLTSDGQSLRIVPLNPISPPSGPLPSHVPGEIRELKPELLALVGGAT